LFLAWVTWVKMSMTMGVSYAWHCHMSRLAYYITIYTTTILYRKILVLLICILYCQVPESIVKLKTTKFFSICLHVNLTCHTRFLLCDTCVCNIGGQWSGELFPICIWASFTFRFYLILFIESPKSIQEGEDAMLHDVSLLC